MEKNVAALMSMDKSALRNQVMLRGQKVRKTATKEMLLDQLYSFDGTRPVANTSADALMAMKSADLKRESKIRGMKMVGKMKKKEILAAIFQHDGQAMPEKKKTKKVPKTLAKKATKR